MNVNSQDIKKMMVNSQDIKKMMVNSQDTKKLCSTLTRRWNVSQDNKKVTWATRPFVLFTFFIPCCLTKKNKLINFNSQ